MITPIEQIQIGFHMLHVKRLVLDILKPHHPNVLEFARAIAITGFDYRVKLEVLEMDDKTESLVLIIEGNDVDLEIIRETITELGASLHSIDGVEVVNIGDDED